MIFLQMLIEHVCDGIREENRNSSMKMIWMFIATMIMIMIFELNKSRNLMTNTIRLLTKNSNQVSKSYLKLITNLISQEDLNKFYENQISNDNERDSNKRYMQVCAFFYSMLGNSNYSEKIHFHCSFLCLFSSEWRRIHRWLQFQSKRGFSSAIVSEKHRRLQLSSTKFSQSICKEISGKWQLILEQYIHFERYE